MIRRFDEVISEKASKQDLRELAKQVSTYTKAVDFEENIEETNRKIFATNDKLVELEKMIDVMGRNVSKDIYSAVRRATSHLVKGDGAGGASLSQGGFGEEAKFLLNSKADKADVESLSLLKANKCDIELSFKWVDLVHKQLK